MKAGVTMSRLVAIGLVLMVANPRAQAPAAVTDAFEVASVKPSVPGGGRDPGRPRPGGRWAAKNTTLYLLLRIAYPEYRFPGLIVGGPSWMTERTFDIDAKATTPNPSTEGYVQMLRQLLANRFHVKVRTEQRPVDVYELLFARSDRRLGPRLRPASDACVAEYESGRLKPQVVPPLFIGERPRSCLANTQETPTSRRTSGTWSFAATAGMLQLLVDRKVIDRTGLTGFYDIDFEFDPRSTRPPDGADDLGVSVFTAVQEQLGLRLEPRRQPTTVLVVESAEIPSEN
jgi:uncharacterized protein (TIGR03435 family)